MAEAIDSLKRRLFDADADADVNDEMSDENLVDIDILKLLLKPRQVLSLAFQAPSGVCAKKISLSFNVVIFKKVVGSISAAIHLFIENPLLYLLTDKNGRSMMKRIKELVSE